MKPKDFLIRKAINSDAPRLKSCMIASYSTYKSRLDINTLPPINTKYENEIDDYPVWVVEIEKKIIGGLILTHEKQYLMISNIAVHPNFQGLGIGRKLVELAEKEAKSHGFLEMRLATHVLLSENVQLYTHLGWSEYERDKTRIYMNKHIEKS